MSTEVTLENMQDPEYPIHVYLTDRDGEKVLLFEEAEDQHEGYFSLKFSDLMQGLHDLGYDVQGWRPKLTLQERVENYLKNSANVGWEGRAATIIKMVEEDKNG